MVLPTQGRPTRGHPIVPLSSTSYNHRTFNRIDERVISKRISHLRPVRTAAFSSTILSHKANLLSERYNYPAYRCRQSSLIQILKFYERPCIVPHEVMRLNVVFPGSLRRNSVFRACCIESECAGSPQLSSIGSAYPLPSP